MSTRDNAETRLPVAPGSTSLRLDAYYYSFDSTGMVEIDRILAAVAAAGKAFHSTENWTDVTEWKRDGCEGRTPIEWIQNAANAAARNLRPNVKMSEPRN